MNAEQVEARLSKQAEQSTQGSGPRMPQQQRWLHSAQLSQGSARGMPQNQQRQAAPRHPAMYNDWKDLRRAMSLKILGEVRNTELVRRIEEAVLRKYPTKAGYNKALEKRTSELVSDAILAISAQGQQLLQMSEQVASSSSYGTRTPTPRMSRTANGNSRMPYFMGTTAMGSNSTTGSIYHGHYHPTTNIPLNSTISSVASVMTSASMQPQATCMIPGLGFSNQQISPANTEYSSGAGSLNWGSNVKPQMQQQLKPFDNQSCYPVQHLGDHAGSGLQPSMLDNSSYSLSDAQMNEDVGLHRSKQLVDRTTASEGFANLSPYYGTSCSKPFQQQLPHEPLFRQRHQFRSDNTNSQFVQHQYSSNPQERNSPHHQVIWRGNSLTQSHLGSDHTEQLLDQGELSHNEMTSSQATEHVNLHGNYLLSNDNNNRRRMPEQLSGSQSFHIPVFDVSQQLLPPPQPQQLDHGSNDVTCFLKGKDTEPLLQPYCTSQPTEKAYMSNSFSIEKQVQDDFCQITISEDRAQKPASSDWRIPGCSVTSLDPKLSTNGSEQAMRNIKNNYDQLRWLLYFKHAEACTAPLGSCKSQYCSFAQALVKHIKHCETKNCADRYCSQTKKLLSHYNNCVDEHCPVCSKVKERLRRSFEQTHKHGPDDSVLISHENTIQKINNGLHHDTMGIDHVAVETFDEQPSASKRLRLEPVSPSASENVIARVLVPEANPGLILREVHPRELEQNNMMVPRQQVSVKVNMHHPQNPVACGYDTHDKIGALQNNVIPGVLNEIDYVKQESLLADKEMNENVLDLKNKTNVPEDIRMSKSGKPKIKGVSLMEFFTPEQISVHINSIKQCVSQGKPKAGKNQALEHPSNKENSCRLCEAEKINFDPPPIYCSPCGARIKRNAPYYTGSTTERRHHFCMLCYNESRSHTLQVEGIQFVKAELEKGKNNGETEEGWVQCDKCEGWQHQICALFNAKRNDVGDAEYTCPDCYIKEIKDGLRVPLPESVVLGAKDLPRTVLSDHIEERLFKRLRKERQDRATRFNKSFDEVPGADGLVVRVVSSVDKKLEVKPRFLEIFQEDNYPAEFPYKSKAVLLFQKIEGVEVCLFAMYVQEFGAECASPNQRRVYVSYLDSVKYFRPAEVKTKTEEALRTYVYHEILIGYLEYCKQRGFTSCYIWACPPFKGEDYILYCHPENQKTPKSDKLREWYLSMLRKATDEGIVVELTNLYDQYFIKAKECNAKVTAARLPYFDGDYWPGTAEDIINQLFLEDDDRKLHKKEKVRKTISKRALRAAGHTDLSGNASKDAILMQKLGEIIYPMKEDFIMVHLQHSCNHCSTLMVSGRRWVCNQCKTFHICGRCYDAEKQLEDIERHPTNSRESHTLHPIEIVGVPEVTEDRDDIMESEFFDTRHAFLSLCQGNHYQYDTLRRAKHSSMMVMYHLHNPTAPAFVTTCNVCNNDIETGQGWRCEECADFDMCFACYQKDGGANHPHKLTNGPADRNAQNKEARQVRVQQTRMMLQLLVHACSCHDRACNYLYCRKVKVLFIHGKVCAKRASGGCDMCSKMWMLLRLHAHTCNDPKCSVVRCRDLKEHRRRMQQLSESRRRAAVNKMMMQRAAEMGRN